MKLRVGLALCVIAAPGAGAEICEPPPHLLLRNPGVVELIGVTTGKVVEAGAGPIRPVDRSNRRVRRTPRIFGSILRVQRVHVDYVRRLGILRPSDSLEAVIVPWEGNSMCGPMALERPLQTAAGVRAVFFGELRDRKYWVGGRPTIDLMPATYGAYVEDERTRAGQALTPDQLLDLSEAMPAYDPNARPDSTYAEMRSLQRWMRENPTLRRRDPAGHIVSYALLRAEQRRIAAATRDFAGSYRFDLVLSGSDSIPLFARTEREATETVWWFDVDSTPFWSIKNEIPRAEGIGLQFLLARNEPSLRVWSGYPDDEWRYRTTVYIAEVPALAGPDSAVWRSRGMYAGAVVALLRHMPLPARSRAARDSLVAQFARDELTSEGRFFRAGRGAIRYDGAILHAGAPVAWIRGRRVSAVTIPEY
jgi:hypothetical protein